jgi:hypothetical protein
MNGTGIHVNDLCAHQDDGGARAHKYTAKEESADCAHSHFGSTLLERSGESPGAGRGDFVAVGCHVGGTIFCWSMVDKEFSNLDSDLGVIKSG